MQAAALDHTGLGSFTSLHLFVDKVRYLAAECSHLEEPIDACWEAIALDFSEGRAFSRGMPPRRTLSFNPMQVLHGSGYSGAPHVHLCGPQPLGYAHSPSATWRNRT